jgi:N-acetyl-gamma-glutamyl-phosphate reductase
VTLPLQTAVVGATGYAGFELARLLHRHPRLAPPLLLHREDSVEVRDLAQEFPQVCGNGALPLYPFSWDRLEQARVGLLFLATPHEVSRQWVPQALARGLRVIDLSGAWRLRRPAHRAVYSFADEDPASAETCQSAAVYGLPELHRERIAGARLVANPGCYATSAILALHPLLQAGLIELAAGIVCDSKSGVTGAGRQATRKTHFAEVASNLSAYSVFGHRHTGEIVEQLHLSDSDLFFTPHLLPLPRGILSTLYLRLCAACTVESVEAVYRRAYAGSPSVRVFGAALPQIQHSLHTNHCDIGFQLSPDGRRMVVISCLDNLLKGAAGQAVQNMNVMFGWDEKEGLP